MTKIQKYMKKKKIKIEEISHHSGIPYSTIYQIVTGKSNPTKSNIDRILHALGVDYEEIF